MSIVKKHHIDVKPEGRAGAIYKFSARIGPRSYLVTVNQDFYRKLTAGKIEPEELIRRSLEFLLERESAGSILPEFDLSVIGKYFPEYESKIKVKSK